jgi:hypothetical protein
MEIKRIMDQGQLGKKFTRPHLTQQLGMVVHAAHSSFLGSINRKNADEASSGKKKCKTLCEK